MAIRQVEGSLIAFLVSIALCGSAASAAVQRDAGQVVFVDPRPLAAAVLDLERRCHCVITYEDVRWTESQVEDALEVPSPSRKGVRVRVPKGRPLTVTLKDKLEAPQEMASAFNAVFRAFEQTGSPGSFRVISSGDGFHIVPADRALFDMRVTVPARTQSVADAIPEILAEAGRASGHRILVGTVPLNLLMATTTRDGATGERFGDVLARVLASTGKALSWRLLYDFGMQAYYLNIHQVR